MCGIAGAISLASDSPGFSDRLESVVERMAGSMSHRGPDAAGLWKSAGAGTALAHRRLAIIDLSEGGRQPMSYGAGRYWVTFNGELYNYKDLRSQLRALDHHFHTESDTEVLLAAVAQWGIDGCLTRTVGMFAFALWDENDRVLHLARDRMGEKPLYLSEINRHLFFASEARAFRVIPGFGGLISAEATAAYLRDGCVSGLTSIYEGVYKLGPGQVVTVRAGGGQCLARSWLRPDMAHSADGELKSRSYWNCRDAALRARQAPISDESAALDQGEELLRQSTRMQMHADVPTGAFLSGGIDSSLVTALMQAQSSQPIRTFTVAFDDPRFDESPHARAIASHLGTRHEEFFLSEKDVVDQVPSLMSSVDEPTANGSFFPVCLISGLARSQVTVALSGDGGDELFAGYNRYGLARRAWLPSRCIPLSLRLRAAELLANHGASRDSWLLGRLAGLGSQVGPAAARRKLARIFKSRTFAETYLRLTSCWDEPSMLEGSFEPPPRHWPDELGDSLSSMLLADQLDYLPDDNLAKVDRASMSVSLETRLPLLDHRVVEFSWQLPNSMKLRGRMTKRLLRGVLDRYVPRSLTERPKMGFTVPTDRWLKGALREWAAEMLRGPQFRAMFPVRHVAIGECWDAYLAGRGPSAQEVWALVMLAAWAHAVGTRSARPQAEPLDRPAASASA